MQWALLALVVVVWSVLGLTGALGTPHPTLSTLVTDATGAPVGRMALLAAWAIAGGLIVRWSST
jgi:hypothetical protein